MTKIMDPPELPRKKSHRFEKRCLHCGRIPDSASYNCDCNDEPWRSQYRALELVLTYDDEGKKDIVQSFNDYLLQHHSGMLQYKALPNHSWGTGSLKVGNTPLLHLENLSKRHNLKLYIKSEGHNPAGCFKDRETLMCLLNTKSRGVKKVVIYSSGNAAGSAAVFAQRNGFHLITFVSGDTYSEKIDFIRSHGSDVVVIGDSETNFETGYRLFSALNAEGYYADAGYDNWSVRNPYRVEGDKTTAVEIVRQMSTHGAGPVVPDFVVIPTANGSCMAGVWKGFTELYELGLIDKLPKMVSAGIKNANPVYKAVQTKNTTSPSICDLTRVDPEDADIGSIILAEEGYDSIQAARAVLQSKGTAVEVQKSDIEKTLHLLLAQERELAVREGILPEPASLISVAAVDKLKDEYDLAPEHRIVSVITGNGVKSISKIRELVPAESGRAGTVEKIYAGKRQQEYAPAPSQGRRVSVEPEAEAVAQAFNNLKH